MDWKQALATLTPHQRVQLEERILSEGERFNIFPLSPTQERLWFSVRRTGGTSMHHIHGALWVAGPIDAHGLSRSLQHLIDRHETLRTTFHEIGSQPRQAIGQPGSVQAPLRLIDLSNLATSEQETEVVRLAIEEREAPFDLAQGPLLRVVLVTLAPASSALVFTIHHLICDGWSMNIFLRELSLVYTALIANQDIALAPLPIQYADFVMWQREELRSLVDQSAFHAWQDRLAQCDLLLDLPFTHLRPAQRTFQSAIYPLSLADDLVEGLQRIGQEEQATLFMVLLTAFQALLYHYTGQHQFVIGTYTANRSRPELVNLIGDCTNLLPLIADFSDSRLSFRDLLGRVRSLVVEAQQFAAIPVGQVASTIWPQIDHSQHPLFPVMFNFFPNRASASLQIPGLVLESIDVPQEQTAMPFDLQFCLWSSHHNHSGYIEYDTDLFTHETIAALVQHMTTLFAGIARNPDRSIGELSLLSPESCTAQYRSISQGSVQLTSAETLPQRLLELAHAQPDAVALDDPQRGEWSYDQIIHLAGNMGYALQSSGIGQGQLIRVIGASSVELVVGVLGVLMAGAVCQLDDSSIDLLSEPAQSSVVLLTQQQIAEWMDGPPKAPSGDESSITAEQIACNLRGMSGEPVLLTHRSLAVILEMYRARSSLGPNDHCLQHSSAFTPTALIELLLPLWAGARLCIAPPETALTPGLLASLRITMAVLPAALLAGWSRESLPPMNTVILVGDTFALPAGWMGQLSHTLIYAIGPAGLSFWPMPARLLSDGQVRFAPGSGLVLNNCQVPLPPGIAGTLFLTGSGMPKGSASADDVPIYPTGIKARLSAEGEIECLGRAEEQLNRGGLRVWSSHLARPVRAIPGVEDALVMPVDTGHASSQQLVVYIILANGADRVQVVSEIQRQVVRSLPSALRPAAVVVLPCWPLNPDGTRAKTSLPLPGREDALQSAVSGGQGTKLHGLKQELLAKRLKEIAQARQSTSDQKGGGRA